jgi:cell wall-associated NlpC family hydrolase
MPRALPRALVTTITAAGLAGSTLLVAPVATAGPEDSRIPAPRHAKAHPVLTVGDEGPAVEFLTRVLGTQRSRTVTPALARRVARFEANRGLQRDGGRVGPATWRALGVPYVASAERWNDRREAKIERRERRQERRSPGSRLFSQAVMDEARKHAGKPYAYGGSGPHSFDCSGLTSYVYRQLGYSLPRTAAAQRSATKTVSRSELKPGDLVFVHSGSYVSHVGLYGGKGRWFEASNPSQPVGYNTPWTSAVSYGRVR